MDAIVIIGFSYTKVDKYTDRPYLPGILIDMYHAYTYSSNLLIEGGSIIIITDLIIDSSIGEIRGSIVNSVVDLEAIHFISNMRRLGYLKDYTCKTQVIDDIVRICSKKKKIFFYYTGHSSNGNILLPLMNDVICYRYDTPDDSIINFSLIRDILRGCTYKNAEIFVILDCCNANGLELPYKLMNKVYRLTSKSDKEYPLQKFICFSSTTIDEFSIASKHGSIFSYFFFKKLSDYRDISKLLHIVSEECYSKYDQTATVHSSYPNLKMVWRWMCHNDFNLTNIKLNHVENYFIIK